MSGRTPNLARRPFVNDRVIGRVAILLWGLAGLLLVGNLIVYRGYLTGTEERREQLAEVEAAIRHERARIVELERELRGLDLERQNRQVGFLNRRIAERTFGWSDLFDRLTEVLPDDVRLQRLSPGFADGREDRRARSRDVDGAVTLAILGEARRDEALLELLDGLFAHPSFGRPQLHRETRDRSGRLAFTLHVPYLPGDPRAVETEEPHLAAAAPDGEIETEPIVPVPLEPTASPAARIE